MHGFGIRHSAFGISELRSPTNGCSSDVRSWWYVSLRPPSTHRQFFEEIKKMPTKKWVPPTDFLSHLPSQGPDEHEDPTSEFASYDGADLDIKFLLALKYASHEATKSVSIPNVYLCIERKDNDLDISYRSGSCNPRTAANRVASIRAGILLVGRGDQVGKERRLYLPPGFRELIDRSKTRFVVFNFGIASTSIYNGHANAFLADKQEQRIIRFDPSGKSCFRIVESVMNRLLPGWHVEQHTHRVPIQTKVTDSFQGMCVTFSLLYVLLTVTNPTRTPNEVHSYLQYQSKHVVKDWVLRLNRRIADTLRSIRKGTLTRRGFVYIVNLPLQKASLRNRQ